MKNKEKYAKEITDISIIGEPFAMHKDTKQICVCASIDCKECAFSSRRYGGKSCDSNKKTWGESEYAEQVKLTANEKAILESIDKKYQWIARSEDGRLDIYSAKPPKGERGWLVKELSYIGPMYIFNHLFQFIKWEDTEPTNIAELLKNCEVLKNE